jgi:hypothetical protein
MTNQFVPEECGHFPIKVPHRIVSFPTFSCLME